MLLVVLGANAQTYTPVAVTGFNVDGFAESGTSTLATTSMDLDLSANVMYTKSFAAANANLGTSGVPDNGTLVNGTRTYQLQPYNQNNILYMTGSGTLAGISNTGTLTLATPTRFSDISLLMFSTEGNSDVDVVLTFIDSTTLVTSNLAIGDFIINDWFNATNPPVIQGFGRTKRAAAGTYTADGPPNNPKFFGIDVSFTCAFKKRYLKSITFTWLSGTSTLTTSRICCLGLSGASYKPLDTTGTVVTNATCGKANGSVALQVSGGVAPYFFSWNTTPQQTTQTATGLAAGSYTATITGSDGCNITYPVTITGTPAATLTASASPVDICATNSSTLTASVTGGTATGYTWSPGTSLTGSSVTVTPADTTTYTVTATDNNGCSVSATTKVNVIPGPNALFSITPGGVCLGTAQTVTYTGNAPAAATYSWNFAGATVQSGSGRGPYNIVFNTPGIYDLQLQVSNSGCTSATNTKKDTVYAPVTASFAVSETQVCAGTPVTVTFTGAATATATATWGWGGGTVQSGTGFGPYTVVYNNTGILSLKVTNGACVSNANSQVVTVIQVPQAAFTADVTKGCLPFGVNFTNQSSAADSYKWTFGDGGTATDQNPTHSYSAEGTYTVSLIAGVQNKCYDTVEKTNYIEVRNVPVAGFSVSPAANVPLELHLATFSFTNSSQGAATYTWHFGDNNTTNEVNPQHKYRATGNFTVVLEAKNDIGCTDTAMLQYIMVKPDKVLDIPNAFSPNGDGINDKWQIDGLYGNPDCQVQVFNRWGQLVFDSHGYDYPWDGTWKGKPVPVATYYYVIKTALKNYNGWVELLR